MGARSQVAAGGAAHRVGDPQTIRGVEPQHCPFCIDWLSNSPSPFDEVLGQSENVNIVPALGMLVPGYVLATTMDHHLSTASLASRVRHDFFAEVELFINSLAVKFGEYIIFEHGSCPTSGSCIDHAHLHLIPATDDFRELVSRSRHWCELNSLDELDRFADVEYGLLGIRGTYSIDTEHLPSQWIRQALANSVGTDAWDWALNYGHSNLELTKRILATSGGEG